MRNFLIVLLVVLAVLAALLAPSWTQYRRAQGVVPPGVRLAGLDLTGATAEEVAAALNQMFEEPVAVFYGEQRILLRPKVVGFEVDLDAMLEEGRVYNVPLRQVQVFMGQVIRRPAAPIDVPLRYKIDADALDNWLTDLANRYDHPPIEPQPLVPTLTIQPGKAGQQLDQSESRARVLAALTSARTRTADLVVHEVAAPPIDITALQALFKARIDEFPGIAAAFLYDVNTGRQIQVNGDVAFAGMSTMKIAILEEVFRKLDQPPDVETVRLITETTSLSGNYTANLLLGIVGDGDPVAGVRVLNNSLRLVGLKNTFMASPYDQRLAATPHIVTEANSRKDINTNPDPYMQTTPRDMGLMLGMIVECSRGGGTLLAAYSGQLTDVECRQALDYLALNEVQALIWEGVPPGTPFVHKHGYVGDTHGDVAAIWGPAGPYVLAVFLYNPPWLEWTLSTSAMKDLSTAAWNYFSMTASNQPIP